MSSTPRAYRIAAQYDDGHDARHYAFAPMQEGLLAAPVQPGQFFTLSLPGLGEAPFTYVRPPDAAGRFEVLVRRVGSLTSRLFELGEGAVVGVRGPFGRGWPLQELLGRRVLVIAGGCGLAPLCSAIDALADSQQTRPVLIYGARSGASQVLSRERAAWAERLPIFETFDHPDGPDQIRGTPLLRLSEARKALGGPAEAALLCGPELMMSRAGAALCDMALSPERIWLSLERRMHCGDGRCGHCYLGSSYVCTDGPTYRLDALRKLQSQSPAPPHQPDAPHHC